MFICSPLRRRIQCHDSAALASSLFSQRRCSRLACRRSQRHRSRSAAPSPILRTGWKAPTASPSKRPPARPPRRESMFPSFSSRISRARASASGARRPSRILPLGTPMSSSSSPTRRGSTALVPKTHRPTHESMQQSPPQISSSSPIHLRRMTLQTVRLPSRRH